MRERRLASILSQHSASKNLRESPAVSLRSRREDPESERQTPSTPKSLNDNEKKWINLVDKKVSQI